MASAETTSRALAAVILAAGRGTRMQSDLPKVAHLVAGRSIVNWVVDACRAAGADPIVLVVGHGAESVRACFAGDDDDLRFALQAEQRGTGHATLCAGGALDGFTGDVLVLAGDGPLIRASTIRLMVDRQRQTHAAATMATSHIPDPTGYGRIVRDDGGRFAAIVEHRNASEEIRRIREVYPSYACFDARKLLDILRTLRPDEGSGEYFITDVFTVLRERGERVEIVDAVPPEDVLSINTPAQLAEVDAILRARLEAPVR